MGDFIRVHCRHCRQTFVTPNAERQQCDLCGQPGGLLRSDALPEDVGRRLRISGKTTGPFPVSRVCPECEGGSYRTVRPDRWVTFQLDRVCTECETHYVPPTPVWAAVVMLVVGLFLLALVSVGFLLSVEAGDVFTLGCEAFLCILGLLALVHGARSLLRPGKV